ncbi:MAG: DUF5343 domain-containing protein [bacterium]|nr:DUF5343 domain-containing protein [bacterium]
MESDFAPYAAPENVLRVLDKVHKNGLRGKIDADFMAQLGIGEGMIPRTLRALEFLGLTKPEDEGVATPLLEQYIVSGEDEAKALLQESIRKAYEVIFRAVDPEEDDRAKVHTAFKVMKPQGQWARMVTLFLGLCRAAGMDVKEPPLNRPGKDEAANDSPVRKAKVKTKENRPRSSSPSTLLSLPPASPRTLDPALVGIIGKIADLETADDLDAWIAMFRAAFEFVKKIPPRKM